MASGVFKPGVSLDESGQEVRYSFGSWYSSDKHGNVPIKTSQTILSWPISVQHMKTLCLKACDVIMEGYSYCSTYS